MLVLVLVLLRYVAPDSCAHHMKLANDIRAALGVFFMILRMRVS